MRCSMMKPAIPRPPRRGGWLLIEVVTAVALLALIIAGLTLTQRTTGTANAIQLARQHCIAAGEAQLEHLSACGRRLEANQIEDLWPGSSEDADAGPAGPRGTLPPL